MRGQVSGGDARTMATVAGRAQRRELEPDWRDRLMATVTAFLARTLGALLLASSLGLGVALLTHQTTDPSWSTAAGGPAENWLGAPGAYLSDILLLLFG